MKNIVIFNRSLLPGGAEKQCIYLARALKGTHNVFLVLLEDNIDPRFQSMIDKSNIHIHILEGSLFNQIRGLITFCRKNRIDIIFSYLFGSNLIAGIAGRISGINHIIGGWRGSIAPEFHKLIIFWVLHFFFLDHIIINNHKGKQYFRRRGFRTDKFTVIHNGIEVANPLTPNSSQSVINLLTVGRFDESKDYTTSLKVFKKACEQNDTIRYIIAGYGKQQAMIENLIEQWNLNDKVHIHIKPDNVEKLYREADIYISTSIYEGLSNTIMEAMNFSLPVVATQVGDNKYMVQHDYNGYLCAPKDVKSLVEKVLELSRNQRKRRGFGEKSHKIIEEQFSLDKMKETYMTFIDSLT